MHELFLPPWRPAIEDRGITPFTGDHPIHRTGCGSSQRGEW
jgi:hypothetical protein